MVPDPQPVPVLRVFDDRLSDRAVGDDRRGVPPADQGHDRRREHVRRPLLHIHRAPDVPVAPGMVHQTGNVRRVRGRVPAEHGVLLLLLSGDEGQDVAGDRDVVREEEDEKGAGCQRLRGRHEPVRNGGRSRLEQQQRQIGVSRHSVQSADEKRAGHRQRRRYRVKFPRRIFFGFFALKKKKKI